MRSDTLVIAVAVVSLAVIASAACVGGEGTAPTPQPSNRTVQVGVGMDGRPVHQNCQWDAKVEVEEDTLLQVLSQTRGTQKVSAGDMVRDDMWPPPAEREGDKDFRGVEKQGPNGGRLFYGLLVHWTEDGVLRSGCKYPASPTPA